VLWGPSRHLGSLTAANWVSFDFNVSYSSCWGCSLINTLKLKKIFVCCLCGPAFSCSSSILTPFLCTQSQNGEDSVSSSCSYLMRAAAACVCAYVCVRVHKQARTDGSYVHLKRKTSDPHHGQRHFVKIKRLWRAPAPCCHVRHDFAII